MSQPLLVQRAERAVILTLNRPEALNALSTELVRAFVRALRTADDDTVATIILTGQGDRAFTACDIVIASSTARFADTHVKVGLLPGWGISQRMARQIGPQRAKEISLTGTFVSAERAFEIGLVNRVVEPPELMPTALSIAHAIAASDTAIVQAYKRVIDEGYALNLAEGLADERRRGRAVVAGLERGHLDQARASASARNRKELS